MIQELGSVKVKSSSSRLPIWNTRQASKKNKQKLSSSDGTLIPALGRQREADLWVWGQSGIQKEFGDSQDYMEKPCFEKPKYKQKTTNHHHHHNKIAENLVCASVAQYVFSMRKVPCSSLRPEEKRKQE